ncbi:MAG: diguanylate cyclase [Lachnospiraceae bacterium]|nr:diguanylate cyclase [Lachnospiraceae bacterium]
MSQVNLPAVYVANGMAIILLLGILTGHTFQLQKKAETIMLYIMDLSLILCCIFDPLVFALDGVPGLGPRIVMYICNFWLFLTNLIFGPTFLLLLERNSTGKNSPLLIWIIAAIDIPSFILLVLNLFTPLIYSVDETNTYHRESFFFFYSMVAVFFIALSMFLYIRIRIKGGIFKHFPFVHFILPMLAGLILQYSFYGISLIWPAGALGLTLMLMTMQNRNILMDKLTGLFNRNYLTTVNLEGKTFCMMMLDLNNFKSINDTYGHSEGDEALKAAAQAMMQAVGNTGTAVRYAGDEFVILINTDNVEEGRACSERINKNLAKYNAVSGKPYELSISAGWDVYDLNQTTLDEVIKSSDELMYNAKQVYYTEHDRRR